MDKKQLVVKYRSLVKLGCAAYNLNSRFRRKSKGTGNIILAPCALLKQTRIRISGSNNTVEIGDFSILNRVSIQIFGDNNHIVIGDWCRMEGTELYIEDSGSTIQIGSGARFLGKTELAAMEGTSIQIGTDCLFSSNVHFRTGDSHSIVDLTGKRINPSKDILVGDHVWVGMNVTCLKGAAVPSNSVIGAGSLVTGAFREPNCVLAGAPAKVVRTGINWDIRRLPVEDTVGPCV